MTTSTRVLTADQRAHFLEHGYIKFEAALPRDFAIGVYREAFAKKGVDPDKPETWTTPTQRFHAGRHYDLFELAPNLAHAAAELLGGIDRVKNRRLGFGTNVIANMFFGEGKPWTLPDENAGWHKDGYFFRHFLDSPEQALLGIVLWSDVVHQGGATMIAPQSIGAIARYLAQHPEGVHPNGFPRQQIMRECPQRIEATGNAGDVYLMHPYMLHTQWLNPHRKIRCIDNAVFQFAEPMSFNRANPEDFSLVELAVLRGLGVERYDFKPTRERVCTPDWGPLPEGV